MAFARRLIPWKYLGVWLGIILAEIILLFILSFYKSNLQNQIYNLENDLSLAKEDLQTILQKNESLKLLGQYLYLRDILDRRKEVGTLLEQFTLKVPKSMILDSLELNLERREMKVSGQFNTWENYIRAAAFWKNDSMFSLVDQGSPTWKDGRVKFNWTFAIK